MKKINEVKSLKKELNNLKRNIKEEKEICILKHEIAAIKPKRISSNVSMILLCEDDNLIEIILGSIVMCIIGTITIAYNVIKEVCEDIEEN